MWPASWRRQHLGQSLHVSGSIEGTMELREALTQIAEIRQQMARGQLFRGYRAATTAFSGAMALATGAVQNLWLPDAAGNLRAYMALWVAAAVVCLVAVGVEMTLRRRRSSQVQRQLTLLAVESFMPAVAAGGLLTWVFWDFLPGEIWMMPGLWLIVFSLGVFASARLLPRMVFALGGFYLVAGILALLLTHEAVADGWRFSPWLMAGPFAVGQGILAAILYVKLERHHD